jgi:hypothetical protein
VVATAAESSMSAANMMLYTAAAATFTRRTILAITRGSSNILTMVRVLLCLHHVLPYAILYFMSHQYEAVVLSCKVHVFSRPQMAERRSGCGHAAAAARHELPTAAGLSCPQ